LSRCDRDGANGGAGHCSKEENPECDEPAGCCCHDEERDWPRIDASGGFDVIGLGDDIEKAFAVSLDLNRPDSTDLLEGTKGARATHGKFSQRPIREYNIRGHVFLAGDYCANSFEVCQEPLFIVPERRIVVLILSRRTRPRGRAPGGSIVWL
jgi:hypothetical protein